MLLNIPITERDEIIISQAKEKSDLLRKYFRFKCLFNWNFADQKVFKESFKRLARKKNIRF